MTLPARAPEAGADRIVPMIGHPVRQTRLPEPFNAHAARTDLHQHMARIDVAPAELAGFVAEVRTRDDVVGFVSTIPHKAEIARLIDERSPNVGITHVCNVVRRDAADRLCGDMTDGLAMCDAIAAEGVTLEGALVTIAGCGAAGRAIALELTRRRARRIELRDVDAGVSHVVLEALATLDASTELEVVGPGDGQGTILVNASPAGMYDDSIPFNGSELDRAEVVADAVTDRVTPLLATAADRSIVTIDGERMAEAQLEPILRFLAAGPTPTSGEG